MNSAITMFHPLFVLSVLFFLLVELSHCHVEKPPRLLLISFDGFRWDYLKKAKVPNMQKMISNGAWSTKGLKNAFITKTLPNHWSLVTGLYEENHGLVGNVFYDPVLNETFHLWIEDEMKDSRWYVDSGEPIWVTDERQNTQHRAGVMMWPVGGAGPVIKGFKPYRSVPYNDVVTLRQRIDTVIEWFMDEYPINLGLLYYPQPDQFGHKFGPDSPEVANMIETLDSDLGYLFEKLEKHQLMSDTNIILTSDHGMTATPQDEEHRIDLNKYIRFDSYSIDSKSPIAAIRPNTKELEAEIFRNLSNIPHVHIYKKQNIPDEFHYRDNRRIDPILVAPDEHYWVAYNNSNGTAANHGYNNSLPSMHPVFMAMGPSFRKGARVEQFNIVDVYPLTCSLLGLKPAPNNGSMEIVKHLLKKHGEGDTSTFGTYMFILIFTGFISGVFGVAACRVHRQYKRRGMHIRSVPELFSSQVNYAKIDDNIPLMPDTSDDEFDLP